MKKFSFMRQFLIRYSIWRVCILVFVCSTAVADTIYVNKNNVGPADGLTFATGWTTINEALTHLAAANVAPNQGGHLILVGTGVYDTEAFNSVTAVGINSDHSGVAGLPNEMRANGEVLIDGTGRSHMVIDLSGASYFIVDGVRVTGGPSRGVYMNGSNYITLRNILAYGMTGHGIFYNNSCAGGIVSNCAAVGNSSSGFGISYSDVKFYNCASVGNGYGFLTAHSKQPLLINNLCYANAVQASISGYGEMQTAEEINEVESPIVGKSEGNIVAHPGWPALASWDLARVYEGSPLLNAGVGGEHIGCEQILSIVAYTSETFYVNAVTGNDGNSGGIGAPWRSLDRASQTVGAGDTVYVAAGTYTGGAIFTNGTAAGAPVRIIGEDGVLVDATGSDIGLTVRGIIEGEISGFDILSATTRNLDIVYSAGAIVRDIRSGSSRMGMSLDHSPAAIVDNVTATNNTVTYGGIFVSYSTRAVFSNLTVRANLFGMQFTASPGSTVSDSVFEKNNMHGFWTYGGCSGIVIERCVSRLNGHSGFYIHALGDSVDMRNCIAYGNDQFGIYLRTNVRDCQFRNCVFYGNGVDGILVDLCSRLDMDNCIVAGNGRYGMNEMRSDRTLYVSNNCFYANDIGNYYDGKSASVKDTENEINGLIYAHDNIVANPMFKDPAAGDFRLQGGSACIDAGTTTTELGTDYYGNPRLVGPAVDMGIYEAPPPGAVIKFW